MSVIALSGGVRNLDTSTISAATRNANGTTSYALSDGTTLVTNPSDTAAVEADLGTPLLIKREIIGVNSVGESVARFYGEATSDATIVAQIGIDALWADGSIYVSCLNGAGRLFMKKNDVWTAID